MEEKFDALAAHKKFAVQCFNGTWELVDKADRTQDDIDKMIHTAHASRYHWGEVVAAGTEKTGTINLERGDWQISMVYAISGMSESALYHAKRCLEICQKNKIGDFDIAFAYEAMARGHAIAGKTKEAKKYIDLAKEAGNAIKEKGDRDYFFSQLKTVPGHKD